MNETDYNNFSALFFSILFFKRMHARVCPLCSRRDRTSERMRIFFPTATARYRNFECHGATARGRVLNLSSVPVSIGDDALTRDASGTFTFLLIPAKDAISRSRFYHIRGATHFHSYFRKNFLQTLERARRNFIPTEP